MRALVVYESMFGNTEAVAQAVTDGLATAADVRVVEVGDPLALVGGGVDLLVVGAPTHALGLSRAATRRDAAGMSDRPLVSPGIGLREWLEEFQPRNPHLVAAAFDTRLARPRLPGSAARAAARRLRRLGIRLAVPATTFRVDGTHGPLLDGELDRARRWGEDLAARVARPAPALR